MASIYETAGGIDKFREIVDAWHERVMADEIVGHAFSHGYKEDHNERLACYLAEACGGPMLYTEKYGDESSVVRMHSGNGEHDDMNRNAVTCFDAALQDAGIASGSELHTSLLEYFDWATYNSMGKYNESADDVPTDIKFPKWDWDGLVTDAVQ